MRTTRIRATVLAATTAALALSLTACGGSDGSGNSGNGSKAGGSRSVATTDDSQSPEVTTTETTETTETVETSGSGAGKAVPARAAKVQACKGDEISYSVLHRFPAEQGEHLLITATNADSKSCWVTSFPSVMLGNASDVLAHSSKDAPGGTTRITVKPGGKVYSAVSLFADNDKTHTSTDLSIALRDQTGDTGPGAGTGAFDDKGAPSEFTWSGAEVTNWNSTKPYDF
ncbi:DUF4232 domain-containing protein [Streptomyces sp. BA2]|uniref:DUF4232 domain-containing protein n=1 Tax=Streptomyces sp. BA2 TaxID=436595 RepID=UPI00132655F2|nr:DUF4232 domain-containing protein [Streptomyces sp. BA2]MWA13737.1 DUF4232 domain-containing protein [Streptomyces sp. BA2]